MSSTLVPMHGMLISIVAFIGMAISPLHAQQVRFTRADTLRGTLTPERTWWDVQHYDLRIRVEPGDSGIEGANTITYHVLAPGQSMQIDLMEPLTVRRVEQDGVALEFRREGDVYFVTMASPQREGTARRITIHYGGRPHVAERPPWDGGFIWSADGKGAAWVATANQGIGARVWWPNKDHQSDEPDSMQIAVTVPQPMVNVSNGRLRERIDNVDGTTTWVWAVTNPINNYTAVVNAGSYAHFGETYEGLLGPLDLDYWVLEEHLERARRQFVQVRPMLACFEDWFGPYPFYEDGFKLVESPHLGMEHQSAIAYGNGYQNGYLGRDLSGTGWGLTWDFIIVHEAGHEWFGNNITTAEIADMWVHEGFTNYSENLFVECLFGKDAGAEYVIGTRAGIQNDRPIIGTYGVHHRGSGDMYSKGGNLLHMIRQLVDDDERWKNVLRGLNAEFRHAIVTSADVEAYIGARTELDLRRVFDQYLRHTAIPTLEYFLRDGLLHYRWRADVDGFDMPVRVTLDGRRYSWIAPTSAEWRQFSVGSSTGDAFAVDENFYVQARRVAPQP